MARGLEQIAAAVRRDRVTRRVGRISRIEAGLIHVANLADHAAVGDQLRIGPGGAIRGEVLNINGSNITVLPEAPAEGLRLGHRAILDGPAFIAPDEGWIGRIVDPHGAPLDGRPLLNGEQARPLHAPPVNPTERRPLGARMETGLAVFNTLLPLVRGQRLGLFAGSGVGKSTLLGQLSQGVEADVVVIALVGERTREVREFVERVMGPAGMRRTVLVVATADHAPVLRRRCAPAAMAVAEHFRDLGKQVLLLVDSVTRLADAHREIAIAAANLPACAAIRRRPCR